MYMVTCVYVSVYGSVHVYMSQISKVTWMGGDTAELRYGITSDESYRFRIMLNEIATYARILKDHCISTATSLEEL